MKFVVTTELHDERRSYELVMEISANNEVHAKELGKRFTRELIPNCMHGCGKNGCLGGGADIDVIRVQRKAA